MCYTYGKQIARTGTSDIIFCYNGRDGEKEVIGKSPTWLSAIKMVTHAGLLGIIEGLHDHRMETVIKVLEKGNYA